MKIKKGDTVRILQGRDRGKEGVVLSARPSQERVIVEGMNTIKRHRKPRRKGEQGQIVEVSAPMAISNVALLCPKCSHATRVGYTLNEAGKKERQCKKCKAVIS